MTGVVPPAITVRNAVTSDAPFVVALISQLAATGGGKSPLTEEYVVHFLSAPGSAVLLAEEKGRVIGLLSYSLRPSLCHAGPSCLIDDLIVDESARGRGAGTALMVTLLDRLVSLGCVEASVAAMPDNHGAIRFYQSLDFRDEAVLLERHFPQGHKTHLMEA